MSISFYKDINLPYFTYSFSPLKQFPVYIEIIFDIWCIYLSISFFTMSHLFDVDISSCDFQPPTVEVWVRTFALTCSRNKSSGLFMYILMFEFIYYILTRSLCKRNMKLMFDFCYQMIVLLCLQKKVYHRI